MNNHHVILGGMGPQASIKLHQLLIGADADTERAPDDYPTILHASLSVPDFIADQLAETEAVKIINDACAALPLHSAQSVGIACNTAHRLLDRLSFPRRNFVSMIEAVVGQLAVLSVKNVGILASPNTIKSGLYRDALDKAGIAVVEPDEPDIEELDTLIHQVIAGHDALALRPRLSAIADHLERRGADAILLGCTELPLIGVDSTLPTIDSLSALASAMLHNK